MRRWNKADVIAVGSLLVAVVAAIAFLVNSSNKGAAYVANQKTDMQADLVVLGYNIKQEARVVEKRAPGRFDPQYIQVDVMLNGCTLTVSRPAYDPAAGTVINGRKVEAFTPLAVVQQEPTQSIEVSLRPEAYSPNEMTEIMSALPEISALPCFNA